MIDKTKIFNFMIPPKNFIYPDNQKFKFQKNTLWIMSWKIPYPPFLMEIREIKLESF